MWVINDDRVRSVTGNPHARRERQPVAKRSVLDFRLLVLVAAQTEFVPPALPEPIRRDQDALSDGVVYRKLHVVRATQKLVRRLMQPDPGRVTLVHVNAFHAARRLVDQQPLDIASVQSHEMV